VSIYVGIVRSLLTTAILCGLVCGDEAAARQASDPRQIRADGHVIGVSVVARLGSGLRCASPESWHWGAEDECPRSLLAGLDVRWRKHALFTPRSAFADLAQVRRLEVVSRETGFDVRIEGGDAAVGYVALLEYRRHSRGSDMQIARRIVRHSEFPEEVWEETKYSFRQ
jgi:hypothetical protein